MFKELILITLFTGRCSAETNLIALAVKLWKASKFVCRFEIYVVKRNQFRDTVNSVLDLEPNLVWSNKQTSKQKNSGGRYDGTKRTDYS